MQVRVSESSRGFDANLDVTVRVLVLMSLLCVNDAEINKPVLKTFLRESEERVRERTKTS